MNFVEKYYSRIISLVSELYDSEFQKTTAGHCMKITGLRINELQKLWEDITAKYKHLDTFIVSEKENNKDKRYISATKLIELRNSEQNPLLVLIPANSRTAAEDSYGNATFKEISLEAVETALYEKLMQTIPTDIKAKVKTILEHPYSHVNSITDKINFLLYLEEEKYSETAIGNALVFLNLMPDSKLVEDNNKLRSRLNLNMKCTEILCDFSIPVVGKIADFPIKQNSIQADIVKFLRENSEIKDRDSIVKLIFETKKELNFANWPINSIYPNEFELFTDDVISKEFIQGNNANKLLKFKDKSKKVTLKIRTVPKPIELESVKFFRVELHVVDGASGTLVNDHVRRMKKTKTNQEYRRIQVELDPNIVETGTYFFRVVAEDETGAKLNIHDKFKNAGVQAQWEEDIKNLKKKQKNTNLRSKKKNF